MEKDAQGSKHWVRKIDLVGSSEGFRFTHYLESNTWTSVCVPQAWGWRSEDMSEHTGRFAQPSANPYKEKHFCVWKHREDTEQGKERNLWLQRHSSPMASNLEFIDQKTRSLCRPNSYTQSNGHGVCPTDRIQAHVFKYTKRLSREDTETVTSQANYTDFSVLQVQRLKNAVERPSSPLYQTRQGGTWVKGIGGSGFEPIKTDEHTSSCKENWISQIYNSK